jgi:hypothetical protein
MSEKERRTPRGSITREEIIEHRGYYDLNGDWNCVLTFPQYPNMLFRGRVEVLILNDCNSIYMVPYGKDRYRIPGGSIERYRSHKYQVAMEAKEEARILLGQIDYTEYSYFKFFKNTYSQYDISWQGSYNEVYVSHFKEWYTGPIKKSVQDEGMYKYGRFVPFEYAINILNDHHKKALKLI